MKNCSRFLLLMLAMAVLAVLPGRAQAQDPPKRAITQIAGDLYRFQNNFHFSVFLVTPEGVIATDPINAAAAKWLKDEIRTRFNQPVKYVVYSHDHADHVSGGEVFADDGAIVVSHEQAKADIIANAVPTAIPDITFTDNLTLTLGGKSVELSFLGKSHSDNMIVARFPDERALFTVDFISVKRLPFRTFRDGFMPDLVTAIDKVGEIDFDILAPGHGALGGKQDAADHGQYVKDLKAEVEAAAAAGKSLEEMQASIKMEKYADWGQYKEWRAENVEGMHRMLTQ
jgi:glyoxylase-like metal-dependent hydrolase (beta-lactamase superfamily II)